MIKNRTFQKITAIAMLLTFITISYIYFGSEGCKQFRKYIRRSIATRKGRILASLKISYQRMNPEEQKGMLNSLSIIHSLSKMNLHEAIPFLMELEIKIYNFFGNKENIDKSRKKEFFDDILVGQYDEVESDLVYLIDFLTKSKCS